jgi:hypothetical protein
MRPWAHRPGTVALLLTLGLVLVGTGATASARSSRFLEFHLPARDGYHVLVQVEGTNTSLTATRDKRGAKTGSLSTYTVRNEAGDGGVKATFGDLGEIAVRFRPVGPITHTRPEEGCHGPDRYTIRHGVFVGSLRFRGEDGYIAVKASRAKGESVSPLALDCAGSTRSARVPASGAGRKPAFLFEAGHRSGLLAEYFSASHEPGGPVRFFASLEQTEGAVAILRLAATEGSPRTFATDDALSFATLAPKAPFAGIGSLTRDTSGARLWNGSLAVSFPGAPDVPLTGPMFKTRLTRSW